MKLIVIVDDQMGLSFNHRRQSRDHILCQYIADLTDGSRMFMNEYSYKLMKPYISDAVVSEACLDEAAEEDYCFVETEDPTAYKDRITELVLCRWNRAYPGDVHFTMDLTDWTLIHTEEFPGSSHEKLTIEFYKHAIATHFAVSARNDSEFHRQ